MKYCDQCGAQLSDNAKFCSACGAPVAQNAAIPEIPICKNCGEPIEAGASFCANCGEPCEASSKGTNEMSISDASKRGTPTKRNEFHKDITEYLGRVVALEKSVYTQTQTIKQLEKKMNSLGFCSNIEEPIPPKEYSSDFSGIGSFIGLGAFIGGIIGLFTDSFLSGIVIGGIIGGILVLGFCLLDEWVENSRRKENYENEMEYYNAAMDADKKRVEEELREKARIGEILDAMKEKRAETSSILNQYYATDILFPKYRNFVAACSLYEYFASGRYSCLTGPDGAYNRYETEVRLDKIITKLDKIINKLDQIKENQYILYDAIQDGNRITQRLVEESVKQSQLAESTANNAALSAHYAEIAANNAEASAWIGVANYISIKEGQM